MKKSSVFSCQNCGAQTPKWLGHCPECGKWGTLVEEIKIEAKKGGRTSLKEEARVLKIKEIKTDKMERIKTGFKELDRVFGGGIVPGSVVLFAGEPGIGKSTLLTQAAVNLASQTIYISGEESAEQIKLRVERLTKKGGDLLLLGETDVDFLIEKIKTQKIKNLVLIVDSIQSLSTTDLSGVAGSISQVREATQRLIELAKKKQIPILLVGHVTKSGLLAGPKTIEHAVDTVLYFEGERSGDLRLLRSVKNRFGPTDEVGVFQMTDKGLVEVVNPSSISLGDRFVKKSGSAYTVVFEGTRPMVLEIQALVTKTFAPLPKRIVNGLEKRRSEMLIAVLQKYLKLPLWEYDVFLNVAGGFKIYEPAADLAVCAAIFSSYKNKPFFQKAVFMGEVSLLGEIGPVGATEKRKKQAQALGFNKIIDFKGFRNLVQLKTLLR